MGKRPSFFHTLKRSGVERDTFRYAKNIYDRLKSSRTDEIPQAGFCPGDPSGAEPDSLGTSRAMYSGLAHNCAKCLLSIYLLGAKNSADWHQSKTRGAFQKKIKHLFFLLITYEDHYPFPSNTTIKP